METTKICLVRHGETAWNAQKRIQGHLDIALNAGGLAQADAAARWLARLSVAALYSSDLSRAWQTAGRIAPVLGVTPTPAPELRERRYGLFEGLTYDEAHARHPADYALFARRDPDYAIPGDGESLRQLEARVTSCLRRLAAAHSGQTIVVVTHGGVLDIVNRFVRGTPLELPRDFPVPNAGINWLTASRNTWGLDVWGETRHLSDTLDEIGFGAVPQPSDARAACYNLPLFQRLVRHTMFSAKDTLAKVDPELWQTIENENRRQEEHIELIASENYVSHAVMAAQGSQLTNKYAEGYPGRRYYGGCEHVDVSEQLAIDRLKKLFGANEYNYAANVQPNSGSQANQAVLMAFAKPGDTIMGMSLAEGGHLTHGMPLNMSGKWFNVVAYGLDAHEAIDYDKMEALAREHKPKIIIAGASAYSLHIDFERFAKVAKEIGAIFWVDMAHYAGLIAAGCYPNPVPHADVVTSTTHKTLRGPRGGVILMKAEHEKAINSAIFPGLQGGPLMHVIAAKAVAFKEAATPEFRNYQEQVVANARVLSRVLAEERGLRIVSGRTESHVFLVDLRAKNITGKEAEAALGKAHITVNKNSIPNDPQKPMVTSGIRIGSPAMTTRGFTEIEAEQVAHLIADVLDAPQDEAVLARVRAEATALCKKFPVYGA